MVFEKVVFTHSSLEILKKKQGLRMLLHGDISLRENYFYR